MARLEQKGNVYQRPLEELLELIPQHRKLAQHALSGDAAARSEIAAKGAEIDLAFNHLEKVILQLGVELQFTDEGLAKRHREYDRAETVGGEWKKLKADIWNLTPEQSAARHLHLIADIRTMITHAGDTSNLILDPDLDSY